MEGWDVMWQSPSLLSLVILDINKRINLNMWRDIWGWLGGVLVMMGES